MRPVFNNMPGQGLGGSPSKLLAWGLGGWSDKIGLAIYSIILSAREYIQTKMKVREF